MLEVVWFAVGEMTQLRWDWHPPIAVILVPADYLPYRFSGLNISTFSLAVAMRPTHAAGYCRPITVFNGAVKVDLPRKRSLALYGSRSGPAQVVAMAPTSFGRWRRAGLDSALVSRWFRADRSVRIHSTRSLEPAIVRAAQPAGHGRPIANLNLANCIAALA